MIIIAGQTRAGKVDRVPGLFYVTTQFFHLYYVPLIPLKSYLIIEGSENGDDFKGVSVPMSFKSVLFGWLRGALVVGILVCAVVGLIAGFEYAAKPHGNDLNTVWVCLAQIAGLALLLWVTYKFSRARYQRAVDLGVHIGLGSELIDRALYGAPPAEDSESPATPAE